MYLSSIPVWTYNKFII